MTTLTPDLRPAKKPRKRLLLVISVVGVVIVGIAATLVWLGVSLLDGPEDMTIELIAEPTAVLSEPYVATVRITNHRDDEVRLGDTDISLELLDALPIVSVEPEMESSETDGINRVFVMRFGKTLGAGESVDFRLVMQPMNPGVFSGEIDQWVGMNFMTAVMTVEVVKAS